MGTNYYIKNPKTGKEIYYIGKSSCGWCFSLHVDPNKDLYDYQSVIKYVQSEVLKGNIIEDEYGTQVSLQDLKSIITERRCPNYTKLTDEYVQGEPYYCKDVEEFLYKNEAEWDDNYNLMRHKVDGEFCIGNGEGPYDYLIGDFF